MPNDCLKVERDLLQKVAHSDEHAFGEIFHYYRDRIYAVALRITHSTTTAEEILQDVFLKIWLRRTDLSNIESFRDYLFVVTRNQAFSALKKMAKAHTSALPCLQAEPVSEQTPAAYLAEKEYAQILQLAVEGLPP